MGRRRSGHQALHAAGIQRLSGPPTGSADGCSASATSARTCCKAIEDIGDIAGESEIYLIGNPGYGLTRSATSIFGGKAPNGAWYYPEAKRQYDGLEFHVAGRVHGYYLNSSYTYSRLYGNYAGLGNSDEGGRSNPANNRSFDDPYYYFDASGSGKYVYGPPWNGSSACLQAVRLARTEEQDSASPSSVSLNRP